MADPGRWRRPVGRRGGCPVDLRGRPDGGVLEHGHRSRRGRCQRPAGCLRPRPDGGYDEPRVGRSRWDVERRCERPAIDLGGRADRGVRLALGRPRGAGVGWRRARCGRPRPLRGLRPRRRVRGDDPHLRGARRRPRRGTERRPGGEPQRPLRGLGIDLPGSHRRPRQPPRGRVRSRPAAGRRAGPAGARLRQASGVGRRRARHGDHERRRLVTAGRDPRVDHRSRRARLRDRGRRLYRHDPPPWPELHRHRRVHPCADPGTGSPAWRSPMVQAARRARSGCAAAARKHR